MTNIAWSLNVQRNGASEINASATAEAEAIDSVTATLPAKPQNEDASSISVDIQPGDIADIKLLVVKASRYDSGLTFAAKDGDGTSTRTVVLDVLQIFSGGSVGLLERTPVQLEFTNNTDQEITVKVFVARLAIQPN